MIQFFCPGCGRRMDLEDFRAGQVGRCLQCRCKFRVPKQAEPSDNPDAAPTPTISRHPALDRQLSALASKRKQSRPPANVPSKPARRAEADEVEEERRPRRRPPKPEPEPVEEDDVVEEVEVTQEVEAESGDQEDTASSSERRRKRKRHKKGSLPTSGLLVGAGVAVLVWIALVAVGFFYQPATYALLILGSITTFAGRRMFLQVAREEGMGPWLSCLFIPFYSTYFFFNRIRQTLVPFLIGCVGYLLLASGGVLWLIHFVWHGDSLHAPGAGRPEHPTAGLVFNVAGQSAHVPIDEMSYHRVKRGRGKLPDSFEFSGEGTSLYGTLPPGFDENWSQLVGKPVNILAREPQSEGGESQITLPGRGVLKVTGGSFTVEHVVGSEGDPVLKGSIRLQVAGPSGPETLEGTFEVQVESD